MSSDLIANILIVIILFAFVAAIIVAVIVLKKMTSTPTEDKVIQAQNQEKGKSGAVASSGDFLPFSQIDDFSIDLGYNQYRAIIEVSSLNFHLKTFEEQQMIEASYTRFLNSLTFPIVTFIQTRTIDNSKVLEDLDNESKDSIKAFPLISEYYEQYRLNLENISSLIGNTKQKKKYIIVSYNEAGNMDELDEEEKKEFSQDELMTRCMAVKDAINGVGLKANILNRVGCAEVLYAHYHRDSYKLASEIIKGKYSQLLSSSPNIMDSFDNKKFMDSFIQEAISKIETQIYGQSLSNEESRLYTHTIASLKALKSASVEELKEVIKSEKKIKSVAIKMANEMADKELELEEEWEDVPELKELDEDVSDVSFDSGSGVSDDDFFKEG